MTATVVATCLDPDAFAAWGRKLGAIAVRERVFVTLDGPLGAGKTTLVQAACDGAGIDEPVTSPTFTLVQRYRRDDPVHHVDLYRIERTEDLFELGWDDLGSGETAVFVEWAERARDRLPPNRWEIRLSIPESGACRGVEASPHGEVPAIPTPP